MHRIAGRPISSTWAIPKFKYAEQLKTKPQKEENVCEEPSPSAVQDVPAEEENERPKEKDHPVENIDVSADLKKKKKKDGPKRADKKVQKLLKKKKRARIVVRNLAFEVICRRIGNGLVELERVEKIIVKCFNVNHVCR